MPTAVTMWDDAITEDVHGLRQQLASKKSLEGSILSRTNIGRHDLIHHGQQKASLNTKPKQGEALSKQDLFLNARVISLRNRGNFSGK